MSLPFERNIVQDNIHQLTDPRNQNGRWECSQCKHEYHVPPIQSVCTICHGSVVRTMDAFQRHGQPHFDLYTPTGAQIYPPNPHILNSQSDRSIVHNTNSIPNLFYIATVNAPDDSYDTLSATWHNYQLLILLRNVSEPLVSYKEFSALLKGVKCSLLKDVLSSIRERATCLHDYQMDCFRREPFFNRIKTSFITLRIFLRVCVNVKLTPLDAMEKLLYVNTDDDLVYKLPVLEDMYHRNMPAIHSQNNFAPLPMQPFSLEHKPLIPYSHRLPNLTPSIPKHNIQQNTNSFTPQIINNNNNIPSFRSSPLIGQSNELSQEIQLCNSIGPNLSGDLYKHPLPRGCATMKPQSNIPDIPMATDGCHGAVTPDTPSIERLDSVSTPSPAPLSPGDQMDTSDTMPDARVLRLSEGQDIILLMKDGEPHLATPLLYIVFPQLKRHHIDCTKNRQDLKLQPKNSTQLEVKVLRDFGMVGKKTFRCLLFSLSDVAKMVKKVDVSIPSCIQRVIDGEIPEERASLLSPVMLGNGFINKPVGNPDKQKHKQPISTTNDSSSTFDWSIEEDTKVTKLPDNKNITPFLPSQTVFSEQHNNDEYLTIDSVVLNNFDMSSLPKFIDLPPILPDGLEELGSDFYSASEGQFYSALTKEMGRVSLLALSIKGFMVCLKELYLNYLSQAGNRHTMKFKMRKLGITSMKATSWQRHKLVDLKALPNLCSICGLITLSEAKKLCAAYKYSFPDTLDNLISLTDKKCKNGRLAVSIPLNSLSVRPKTPTGDISAPECEDSPTPSVKDTNGRLEKSKVLKLHLSQQPLNNFATPTRAPKTIKSNPNNTIGTKKCKECGLVQSRFAKKCSQCHAYLQGSPCPKCEKLNIAYYSHCYSCFTKLDRNRGLETAKASGRISKKKLLQNQLDSVPYSQNGSNISPIQVSCIRCGKIKQSGKFNCLRCGSTFSVNPSNQKGRKECIELCDTHEDFRVILELFESLKQLDLVSVLLPLVTKVRTETAEMLERQELTLHELEREKNTSTQFPNVKERGKIELKISKLEQQVTATNQEIFKTSQQIQTNKQILSDKENKILENKHNIYDCERFIKMLPSS